MKRFKYILIGLLGFSLVSCNDFLEEKQRSNRDNPFTTPADAVASVNGLYRSGFPAFHNAGSAYVAPYSYYGGYMSGLYDNEYAGQHMFNTHMYNLDVQSGADNGELVRLWANLYDAITKRANFAIKGIPRTPGMSDSDKSKLLAEAKFFRALNYFTLVKMFGAVPIISEPVEDLKGDIYPRRSSVKLVYEFIEKDLLDALDGGLNDKSMSSNEGRVSKGSVLALLSDVYLNMAGAPLNDKSKYAEAAKYSKMVMDNPAYALIQNKDMGANSAYNIIRTSDKETEYLYYYEFLSTITKADWYPTYAFPSTFVAAYPGKIAYSITCAVYNPNDKLLKVYDPSNDLRIQEGQFFHTTWDGLPLIKPKEGEAPSLKKFPHFFLEEEALKTGLGGKNRTIYRSALMYLTFAEAEAISKGQVTADAVDALATIQARASMNKTKDQIKADLVSLNLDQFVQEVWRERIREFIFECKIWNDISRTLKYPNIESSNIDFIDLIGAKNSFGNTFEEKDLTYPYPRSAYDRNPNLSLDPITE